MLCGGGEGGDCAIHKRGGQSDFVNCLGGISLNINRKKPLKWLK